MSSRPFHDANLKNASLPPIPILAVLAAVDTFVVCLATAPWLFQDIHSPRALLAPIVNGPLIALLLAVEITFWNLLRNRANPWQTEANAAFATVSRTPRGITSREPIPSPAVILIHRNPGRFARLGYFVVYVDGQPRTNVRSEEVIRVVVPAGRHQVFIKSGPTKSETVPVALKGGEQLELVCGARTSVGSRFFRFFELKLWFVATPVAFAAFHIPDVARFVERHFAAEFLAIVFIAHLGILINLLRYFSRKPGALIYLMESAALADST